MLEPLKSGLADFLHLSKDALHVHLGIALYLAAALLLRRPLGSGLPLLILFGFELVNEGFDLAHDADHGGIGIGSLAASAKDIVNTMFWPTLLTVAVRFGALRERDAGPGARHRAASRPAD
jgi:hypothetical protein